MTQSSKTPENPAPSSGEEKIKAKLATVRAMTEQDAKKGCNALLNVLNSLTYDEVAENLPLLLAEVRPITEQDAGQGYEALADIADHLTYDQVAPNLPALLAEVRAITQLNAREGRLALQEIIGYLSSNETNALLVEVHAITEQNAEEGRDAMLAVIDDLKSENMLVQNLSSFVPLVRELQNTHPNIVQDVLEYLPETLKNRVLMYQSQKLHGSFNNTADADVQAVMEFMDAVYQPEAPTAPAPASTPSTP